MKDSLLKFRFIFIPYLIIAVCLIGGITFLNWLLIIHLRLIEPKEIYIEFAIPAILAFLASFIWIRPRIKVLRFKEREDDRHFVYWFFPVLFLAVPAIMLQMHVAKSFGKLVELPKIENIYDQPLEKYYTVGQLYIDKERAGYSTDFSNTDNGKKFRMEIFGVFPVYNSVGDLSDNTIPFAWYAKKFVDDISNSLSPSEKEDEFRTFASNTEAEIGRMSFAGYQYFEREGNTDDFENYSEAVKNSLAYVGGDAPIVILRPHTESFESRSGTMPVWISIISIGGLLVFWIMLLFPKIDRKMIKQNAKDKTNPLVAAIRSFTEPLIPEKGLYGVYGLVAVNCLVFAVMVVVTGSFVEFKVSDLIAWGGESHDLIFEKWQIWRLFTCMFVHAGVLHLLMNMFALFMGAVFFEPIIGTKRFIVIYVVTGLCASVCSAVFNTDVSVSVGASGAVMGIYGVLIAFLVTGIFGKDGFKSIGLFLFVFVGYNLLMGLFTNADNAAHAGGLIAGFIIGFILRFAIQWHWVENEDDTTDAKYE